jgi:hypothetical protein
MKESGSKTYNVDGLTPKVTGVLVFRQEPCRNLRIYGQPA